MKKLLFIPILFTCQILIGQSSNSFNVIGKPIRIGNLFVAEYNFPEEMDWINAKKACESLGNGWRLPTKKELILMEENHDKLERFYNRRWKNIF